MTAIRLDVIDEKRLAALVAELEAGTFFSPIKSATATPDGTGTGALSGDGALQLVLVTSGDANNIVTLPAPTPGRVVVLCVGANGFELRTTDPATIGINGGTGASAESAIAANTTAILICESATAWKGLELEGTAGTLGSVEVAA